MQYLSLEKVMT